MLRGGASSTTLYLQPLVSVSVGASPACSLSHCQAGVAMLGGPGNVTGSYYKRGSGETTYPFTMTVNGVGEGLPAPVEQVLVSVQTPLGPCPFLYVSASADAASVLDA